MPILLVREDREYLCELGEELQTDLGVLTVPEDAAPGDTIETHLGESFRVRQLRGQDLFHHFERSGAPMLPRDIGLVLGYTGIGTDDRVLDAGTGTGVLAAYLGRVGAQVVTYEQDAEFASIARENLSMAGVSDSVEVRSDDVTTALDELGGFDAVTLDLEAAPVVIERTPSLLRPGGVIACYTPFVESTREVVMAAREADLGGIETYETLQREMEFDSRGSRPTPTGVGHTGFLTVARYD